MQHESSIVRSELRYSVADDILSVDNAIPLTWWVNVENFGDLLSPWLVEKMTGRSVVFNDGSSPCYIAIGSVMRRVRDDTIVWGSGCFGTEPKKQLNANADYRAVRGPLTRNKLRIAKIPCPEVYGDPALLVPFFHYPQVERTHEVGVILRWSEREWNNCKFGSGIKKIYLKTDKVEEVLDDILSCKKIVSSSLHGLIIADAYGIPNAWLASHTPKGGEFKFYDYFLSVNKSRKSAPFDFSSGKVTLSNLLSQFDFDSRKIDFDYEALLRACPLIKPAGP